MNKNEVRILLKDIRDNLQNRDVKEKVIISNIIALPEYQNSHVIALYKSINSEVNLDYLINYSLDLNKIVLLPRIVDKKMIFIAIKQDTRYSLSKFGILEPIGEEYLGHIDLMIVPGLGFNKSGYRLGYGGGYYDQYLKDKDIDTIGICFNEQIIELPIEKHDVKMKKIVFE